VLPIIPDLPGIHDICCIQHVCKYRGIEPKAEVSTQQFLWKTPARRVVLVHACCAWARHGFLPILQEATVSVFANISFSARRFLILQLSACFK
jgi:hypothetical protein